MSCTTIVEGGRSAKQRESVVAWSNQGFGHSSLDFFRPVLQRVGSLMLCTVIGGEISNRFAIGDLERSPHTYSCTWLYSKEKQKWGQGTLPVLNTGESKLY